MTAYTYVHKQCSLDPRCEYAEGHTCDCTPIEIAKHVLKLREDAWDYAYKQRLDCIFRKVHADWLEALIQEGTSPLLDVGWVSVRSTGYKVKQASTWHRDRDCKRNRAMGSLRPKLRLEWNRWSGITACAGCAKTTEEERRRIAEDYRREKEMKLAATEGLCWGQYGGCGHDVEAGWTVCSKHAAIVTDACRNGDHAACGKVLGTHTRQDGTTYTTDCACQRCHR